MGRRGKPTSLTALLSSLQAKFFTEVRLLQRAIKVRLLSAPVSLSAAAMSGPTPAAAAGKGNALPAPSAGGASIIIGTA
jgi:staphylococcal nuclease domain-containing protein 1